MLGRFIARKRSATMATAVNSATAASLVRIFFLFNIKNPPSPLKTHREERGMQIPDRLAGCEKPTAENILRLSDNSPSRQHLNAQFFYSNYFWHNTDGLFYHILFIFTRFLLNSLYPMHIL
jgi:hypothetical protein